MEGNRENLIKPRRLEIDKDTRTDFYGKFSYEPLERGFGITLGNSLRRVMLSSLAGVAVSAVRIKGVVNEFDSIPGVKEDVTEIILNLKKLRFRLLGGDARETRIDSKGEGDVKAGDIICDNMIEVVNRDQHIATLSEDAELKMELMVKLGRGYVPAEVNKDNDQPVGTIFIDSTYSPIKRVSYNVGNARVEQKTDYDKLILEVWTNGAIFPEDAVASAANILRDQLNVFINFEEEPEPEDTTVSKEEDEFNKNLIRSVDELELSVRSANCLRNASIRLIGELVQKSEHEMLKTKNFGRKSLNEIKEVLTEMNLGLGMKFDNFPPLEETPLEEKPLDDEEAEDQVTEEGQIEEKPLDDEEAEDQVTEEGQIEEKPLDDEEAEDKVTEEE